MKLHLLSSVALATAMAAASPAAALVVTDTLATNEWGVVAFTATGGVITFDVLGYGWTGGATGNGLVDPFLTIMMDDGSSLSAFTGAYMGANDDSWTTFDDGSTSALDPWLQLSLGAGDYYAIISNCCRNFTSYRDATALTSGVYNGPRDYQLTMTGAVSSATVRGHTVGTQVPLPAAAPMLLGALAMAAAAARRRA